MAKLTTEDYEILAAALHAKGYTADTVYPVLEKSGFKIRLKETGVTYSGIYASRVIALMHELADGGEVFEI